MKATIFATPKSGYYILSSTSEECEFNGDNNSTIVIDTEIPFVPEKDFELDISGLDGRYLYEDKEKISIISCTIRTNIISYKFNNNTLYIHC